MRPSNRLVRALTSLPGGALALSLAACGATLGDVPPESAGAPASTAPSSAAAPPSALPRAAPPALPGTGCVIQDNDTGKGKTGNGDALFLTLTAQADCPANVFGLRQLLQAKGMTLHPAFVDDRGYNNPLPQASFSFFEGVTGPSPAGSLAFGEFFFGHFTETLDCGVTLSAQQEATPNALMIELIVWDPGKGAFNFYEERGSAQGGVWFYRGDSMDITADLALVNRNVDPTKPLFGQRLRCSGCHQNGGPIMKELAFPHDAWWRKERPLPLGGLKVAPDLQPILAEVVDASTFAGWIKAGDQRLEQSKKYREALGRLTLQEQLRPLFCAQEVNLETDLEPLSGPGDVIKAPVGFFVDPRLAAEAKEPITLKKDLYVKALNAFAASYSDAGSGAATCPSTPPPPPSLSTLDADHAWEAPVKSHTDIRVVDVLIDQKVIDLEFALDVLAIDLTRPVFSEDRCQLLRLVPERAGAGWQKDFEKALAASSSPAAKELALNLRDPARNAAFHRKRAAEFLRLVQGNVGRAEVVTGLVRLLAQDRIAAFAAQISQNPKGQILEPDFRLIFPTFGKLKKNQQDVAFGGVPGQYWLSPRSGVVELTPVR